jgi:hypothetical protein
MMKHNEYQWIKATDNGKFAPRDGAGALVYDGAMWLIGGWNPDDKNLFPKICSNDVWTSINGLEWTQVKPNTFIDAYFNSKLDWEGRHTVGYVVFDESMWIIGGDANQGHYQYDVWRSNDGKHWSFVNPDHLAPWGPRVLHHTLVFKDRIWVIGGQTIPQLAPADEVIYHDIWTTRDGVNWETIEMQDPFFPPRGMIGNSAVFQDKIWLLGGGTYDMPIKSIRNFYNDVWSSSDGSRWQRVLEHAPWAPRQYHEVAVFDDKLWVLEGWDGKQNRNDVWWSSDGIAWNELPNTPWAVRHAASVFVYQNALWVVAGNNMESDVWKLIKV